MLLEVLESDISGNIPLCELELYTYLITYLLTELSPSWRAVYCAAPQEPPSILWNPKVHHRVHKSPPLVPILSHINPIHSKWHYIELANVESHTPFFVNCANTSLPRRMLPLGMFTLHNFHKGMFPHITRESPRGVRMRPAWGGSWWGRLH
jgi:hypothetical protein